VIDDGSRDGSRKQLSAFPDRVRIVLTALGVSDANAYKVVENTTHEAATKIEAVRRSETGLLREIEPASRSEQRRSQGATLRFVRKGVALLIEAWLKARLRDADLTLVGALPTASCRLCLPAPDIPAPRPR